ncbi:MAG: phage major capsid protein [Actinomycetota bacterium]|nr:phage major capsid protein [Actinomycetota bacterium]
MKEMLKRLLDQRASVWEQMKALNDAVLSEERDYSAEENISYERMSTEMDKLDARIADVRKQVEGEARAEEARALLDHDPRPGNPEPRNEQPTIAERLDALRRGEVRAVEIGPEARDLTKGTAAAGGNLVATDFLSQLYEHMIETSAIRQTNVTVITTDGGNDLQVPKTSSYSTASIVSEGGAIGESDPAFGQVTLQAFKYGFLTQVSSELEQDQSINDFSSFLARQGGRALGDGSGAHFVTGTGTAQPNGVVTAATVGKTGGTGQSGVPTADELIDLFFSVIPPYRRNAHWMMEDATWKAVRKLKDANNNYLVGPLGVEGDLVLLGRPVVIDTHVASTGLSAKSVAFGDFSGYYIRDVRGVRIERSADFAFANDLATYRFLVRTDGDLVDTNAVKTYQGAAT